MGPPLLFRWDYPGMILLLCLFLVMIGLTAIDCCEARRGVKFILSFQASSRTYEEYSTGGAVLSRCIRKGFEKVRDIEN